MRLGFGILWLVVLISSALAVSQDDLQKLIETGSCSECDLQGADLSGADLSMADLYVVK